ncbi:MAG: hypothetical protein H7325_06765 [Pedobacter sp.]|nr:hypothetical protein [Pedobacter sp.]
MKDTLTYANTMKNGTATQKAQMQILGGIQIGQTEKKNVLKDLGKDVAIGLFENIG